MKKLSQWETLGYSNRI